MCVVAIPALMAAATEVSATTTALSIASAVASAAGAVQQYRGLQAQADYQQKANNIAAGQIETEARQTQMDAERQRQQQYEQATSEVNQYETNAMKERASVEALIGEYGGGNTGARQLSTLSTQEGQDLATLKSNATKQQSALGLQQSADLYSINSKTSGLAPAQRPSAAGLGLSLAGSALQLGSRLNKLGDPNGDLSKTLAQKRQNAVYETMPYLRSNRSLGD